MKPKRKRKKKTRFLFGSSTRKVGSIEGGGVADNDANRLRVLGCCKNKRLLSLVSAGPISPLSATTDPVLRRAQVGSRMGVVNLVPVGRDGREKVGRRASEGLDVGRRVVCARRERRRRERKVRERALDRALLTRRLKGRVRSLRLMLLVAIRLVRRGMLLLLLLVGRRLVVIKVRLLGLRVGITRLPDVARVRLSLLLRLVRRRRRGR